MIGTSISRYDILEELGQGGMSVVYLAQDTGLNRQVAIKVMHSHLANKAENRKRFRREAEAIARLRHPNILDVYDVSAASEERAFIVMEYVEGMNLRQFIDQHGAPPAEVACLLGVKICDALTHAHRHGVIHRDLKPENVMIAKDGALKLTDFGIAHVIGAETMTRTGSLIGSPAHMAPEVIDGAQIDERADIFSLGTVLYWISTARLPFSGENTPQVLRNVLEGRFEPPDIVQPTINHDLAGIIERTLKRDPAERYDTPESLKRDLYAAVHAVGFDEEEAVLKAYFDAPEAYTEAFPAEIIPRLINCGKRAVDAGNTPLAINYFNRVLAYEPQNEQVQAYLYRFHQSRKLWRVGATVAALSVALVGGWMLFQAFTQEGDSGEVNSAAEVAEAQAPRVADGVEQARERLQQAVDSAREQIPSLYALQLAESTRDRAESLAKNAPEADSAAAKTRQLRLNNEERPKFKPPIQKRVSAPTLEQRSPQASAKDKDEVEAEKPARPTRVPVHFRVFPPPTQLELDGEPVRWQLGPVELEPGEYKLSASAPGCKPFRSTLVVDEESDERVPVVLDWEDAVIRVESNRNVLVYVDQEVNPRANAPVSSIRVSFPRGKFYSPRTMTLRISDTADLQRVQTREVVVEPGESQVVRVNFP